MKTIQFNKNSWHHRLAVLANLGAYETDINLCYYIRKVLLGLVFAVLILSGVGLILYAVGDFIGYTVSVIMTHHFEEPHTGALFIMVMLGSCSVFLILHGVQMCTSYLSEAKYKARQEQNLEPRPERKPSFIATAYRSIKDKTCFKIELT